MSPSKLSLSCILLGLAALITGAIFKLNHLMGAVSILNLGLLLIVLGLVAWVVGLFKKGR